MIDPVELAGAPARLLTPRFVLVVTCGLFYFLALAMLTPVIPHYVQDSMHDNGVAVGLAVGAFSVGAIALRLFAGRAGDRSGRRVLIIAGALVVSVSTIAYGAIHALWWLVLMRIVTGFGEAGFFVGAATMITDLSPADRRGEAISYWSIAVYGGLSFGPALGELARHGAHYEFAFAVSAVLSFVAAVIGLFTVEVERPAREGPPPPLVHPAAVRPGTVLFLGLIPLAGFTAFMPLYASDHLHVSSGLIFLEYGVLVMVVRVVGARLPDRLGARTAGSIALACAAAGIAVIAAWPTVAGLATGTVVLATGMTFMYPALLLLALDGIGDDDRASVVGTFSSFFDASQGLGALICGAVVAFAGNRGAFTTGAVCSVAGFALLRARTGASS